MKTLPLHIPYHYYLNSQLSHRAHWGHVFGLRAFFLLILTLHQTERRHGREENAAAALGS